MGDSRSAVISLGVLRDALKHAEKSVTY